MTDTLYPMAASINVYSTGNDYLVGSTHLDNLDNFTG